MRELSISLGKCRLRSEIPHSSSHVLLLKRYICNGTCNLIQTPYYLNKTKLPATSREHCLSHIRQKHKAHLFQPQKRLCELLEETILPERLTSNAIRCQADQYCANCKIYPRIPLNIYIFVYAELYLAYLKNLTFLHLQCSFKHFPRPSEAPQLSGHACKLQSLPIQSP